MTRSMGWAGAFAALVLVGCTSSSETSSRASDPNRRCFFASSVSSFAAVDSRTVNIRVGVNDFYRLNLLSSCRDVTWTTGMGLSTRGSSSICTGSALGTTLTTRGPSGRQRCSVGTVVALTPEEVQALSGRQRP